MSVVGLSADDWEWHGFEGDVEWMVSVQLVDGQIYLESGPADPGARCHESSGGRQSFADFLSKPPGWVDDYPDLAEVVTKVVKFRVGKDEVHLKVRRLEG